MTLIELEWNIAMAVDALRTAEEAVVLAAAAYADAQRCWQASRAYWSNPQGVPYCDGHPPLAERVGTPAYDWWAL